MAIYMKMDYETAKEYNGKYIMYNGESGKESAYLMVQCNEKNINEAIDLAYESKNVLCIEYIGEVESKIFQDIHITNSVLVFRSESLTNINAEEIYNMFTKLPKHVDLDIELPSNYNDLQNIYNLSNSFPLLRFIGGNLFRIKGVNLGHFSEYFLKNRNIKYTIDSYLTKEQIDLIPCVDYKKERIEATEDKIMVLNTTPKEKKEARTNDVVVTSFKDLLAM